MDYRYGLIVGSLCMASCWPPPIHPEEHTGCSSACGRLRVLACEEGSPTPRGSSCEEVCVTVASVEYAAPWPTECITRASSCAQAQGCE